MSALPLPIAVLLGRLGVVAVDVADGHDVAVLLEPLASPEPRPPVPMQPSRGRSFGAWSRRPWSASRGNRTAAAGHRPRPRPWSAGSRVVSRPLAHRRFSPGQGFNGIHSRSAPRSHRPGSATARTYPRTAGDPFASRYTRFRTPTPDRPGPFRVRPRSGMITHPLKIILINPTDVKNIDHLFLQSSPGGGKCGRFPRRRPAVTRPGVGG